MAVDDFACLTSKARAPFHRVEISEPSAAAPRRVVAIQLFDLVDDSVSLRRRIRASSKLHSFGRSDSGVRKVGAPLACDSPP